jgi:hypothetical protein
LYDCEQEGGQEINGLGSADPIQKGRRIDPARKQHECQNGEADLGRYQDPAGLLSAGDFSSLRR